MDDPTHERPMTAQEAADSIKAAQGIVNHAEKALYTAQSALELLKALGDVSLAELAAAEARVVAAEQAYTDAEAELGRVTQRAEVIYARVRRDGVLAGEADMIRVRKAEADREAHRIRYLAAGGSPAGFESSWRSMEQHLADEADKRKKEPSTDTLP